MKKKLLAMLLMVVLVFSFVGCGNSNIIDIDNVLQSPDTKTIDFEVVDNNYYGVILVDQNTGVMYYWITSEAGGMTPIYNADGTLKLYEE